MVTAFLRTWGKYGAHSFSHKDLLYGVAVPGCDAVLDIQTGRLGQILAVRLSFLGRREPGAISQGPEEQKEFPVCCRQEKQSEQEHSARAHVLVGKV
jgi:hypothetical protein